MEFTTEISRLILNVVREAPWLNTNATSHWSEPMGLIADADGIASARVVRIRSLFFGGLGAEAGVVRP